MSECRVLAEKKKLFCRRILMAIPRAKKKNSTLTTESRWKRWLDAKFKIIDFFNALLGRCFLRKRQTYKKVEVLLAGTAGKNVCFFHHKQPCLNTFFSSRSDTTDGTDALNGDRMRNNKKVSFRALPFFHLITVNYDPLCCL